MDEQVRETFELWKGLTPSEAYLSGEDDRKGTLFVPTRENINTKRREIDGIWRSTEDVSIRAILRWARCYLDLREPHSPPQDIIRGLTVHLVKDGIDNRSLIGLMNISTSFMAHAISDLKLHRWPLEIHVAALHSTGILKSMLEALKRNGARSQELDDLMDEVRTYEDKFPSKDIIGSSFKEMISFIGEGDGHLGRSDIFPRVLGEMYGCPERYDMIEEKILIELYRELPRLKRSSFKIKETLGTTLDSEEIFEAIALNRSVKKGDTLQIIESLRDRMAFWGVRRIIDYPHERDVGVVETPEYLRPVLGIGGSMNLNGLTGRPMCDLFITTENFGKRPMSYPEIFLFLAGEELGQRAHYLNSILRPKGTVIPVEKLPGPFMVTTILGSMSNRLLQVKKIVGDLIDKGTGLLPDERRFIDHINGSYPLKELIPELEFMVSRKRVLDLLSGVADIRLNTGKHSIAEFIRWANIITGMEKDILMETINGPLMDPGHFATRQMISVELGEITTAMEKKGVSLIDFNTILTRMGFPPWKFLRERLLRV